MGGIKYAWPASAFCCPPASRKPLTEARGEGADFLVPAGAYRLVCSREGYVSIERPVTVVEGEVLIADFALVPLAARPGRPADGADCPLLPEAHINVPGEGTACPGTRTDPGSLRAPGLMPDACCPVFSLPGLNSAIKSIAAYCSFFPDSGLEEANTEMRYASPADTTPTGNLFSLDPSDWWDSTRADTTTFDYLVVQPNENTAYLPEESVFCDAFGYMPLPWW